MATTGEELPIKKNDDNKNDILNFLDNFQRWFIFKKKKMHLANSTWLTGWQKKKKNETH